MARRRSKRLKWYAGGGLVLLLAFLLGDPAGVFRPGPGPDAVGGGVPDRDAANRSKVAEPQPPAKQKPTAELAGDADPLPAGVIPASKPVRSRARELGESDEHTPPRLALLDQAKGIIRRYEHAIAADRLTELARLVEQIRVRPIEVPEELKEQWAVVQGRADGALTFGGRLRDMLRGGEVLAARRMVRALRRSDAPAGLREQLDAVAQKHEWPALTREWKVVAGGEDKKGGASLPKLRRVRFVKDGRLHEGRMWRCTATSATVEFADAAGISLPTLARHDVEPADPTPEEAFGEGMVAARAGDALGVALWVCHLRERGAADAAASLSRRLQ